jgi:hypothetical protein
MSKPTWMNTASVRPRRLFFALNGHLEGSRRPSSTEKEVHDDEQTKHAMRTVNRDALDVERGSRSKST